MWGVLIGFRGVRGVGEFFQREEISDRFTALRPGTGVDLRGAVVEIDEGLVGEIESVSPLRACQGELVPEAAGDADPGHAVGFDQLAGFQAAFFQAGEHAFELDGVVEAPFVGQDVCHACLCGGVDQFRLRVLGCHYAHGDDQDFLTFECRDERGFIFVVDFLGRDAFGHFVRAVGTSDGCNLVLTAGE